MIRNHVSRRLSLEKFEERALMAVGASLVRGTLSIEGTESADTIIVSTRDTSLGRLVDYNISYRGGAQGGFFYAKDVTSLQLSGMGGGDKLINATSLRSTLIGGEGNDLLVGGSNGDLLDGGQGNDLLFGRGGNDQLNGGVGENVLTGGTGSDVYQLYHRNSTNKVFEAANVDVDTIDLSQLSAGAGVTADLSTGAINAKTLLARSNRLDVALGQMSATIYEIDNSDFSNQVALEFLTAISIDQTASLVAGSTVRSATGIENLIGTSGNDTLAGNSRSNQISGLAGDDLIGGGDQADRLDGGDGADVLYGEGGDDTLIGGWDLSVDLLMGGAGADVFYINYPYDPQSGTRSLRTLVLDFAPTAGDQRW